MQIALKSLIISPDPPSRVRLKEALNRTTIKNTVFQTKDCREALQIVKRESDIATIFFHSTIDQDYIALLQKEIENSNVRYRPIFVISLHTDHNLSDYISQQLVGGVEGFLKEPFATNDVEDVIQVAIENRQKQIEEEEIELKAFQFMLREGFALVDQAALERSANAGKGGGFALKRMKRLKLRVRGQGKKLLEEQYLPIFEEELATQLKQLDLSVFKRKEQKVKFAEHPGKVLTEIITLRSLSPERLCELLSVEEEYLTAVLNQQNSLTPSVCKALARVIGKTSDYWNSLQKDYDDFARSKRLG